MTEVTHAAADLARLLEQENAALAALDLPRANAMLPDKLAVAGRLAALLRAAQTADPASVARLRSLAEQNRRLLHRAIAVQGEVIALVAGTLPRAAGPPRYAPGRSPLRAAPPVPFALSARA
jgi:hypothetical protein